MTLVRAVPCPVLEATPASADHLFGFNDISPWCEEDDALAVLRLPESLPRVPDGADEAEICIWRPAENSIRPIATTVAWNYQQGARQRWLSGGRLMFNDVREGRERAAVVDRDGRPLHDYGRAIYALAPDESVGISPSFARLAAYYPPGYGYPGAQAAWVDHPCPEEDGVWAIDLATGASRLVVSLAALARGSGLPAHMAHFVSHMWFNFSGSELLFVHGAATSDGGVYGRLMVMAPDGANLRCVAEELVSHPCWIDDDRLLLWTRHSRAMAAARSSPLFSKPLLRSGVRLFRRWQGRLRNRILAEGLTQVSAHDRNGHRLIAGDAICENGHFSRHPRLQLIVGDTYADADARLHLYLYDFGADTKIEMGSFHHGVRWANGLLRSDLHPRWNRAGTRIAVDVSDAGVRRVLIVDAIPALAALGRA